MMKSSTLSLLCLAATRAVAAQDDQPPIVISQVVDSFIWKDPFGSYATPPGFLATCEATGAFKASQHSLADLTVPGPLGLAPWADAIKYFFGGHPYPGTWDGVDNRGTNRDLIKMEYVDVPEAVKEWIRTQVKWDEHGHTRWLFAVYDKPKEEGEKIGRPARDGEGSDDQKVMLFAAGALYEILPLFLAKGSECEGKSYCLYTLPGT
jgi:hypothetical protein